MFNFNFNFNRFTRLNPLGRHLDKVLVNSARVAAQLYFSRGSFVSKILYLQKFLAIIKGVLFLR